MTPAVRTVFVVASLFATQAHAADAPAELRGKSIRISWTENRIQRAADDPDFRSRSVQQELAIYVGSTGRVFNRMSVTARRGHASNDQVAGEQGARRVPQFAGRTLQMLLPFRNTAGLRRISADFDEGFNSCSAKVTYPRDGSNANLVGKSRITGDRIEIQSISASGESCSVVTGNILGE
jgi:hypothetical protein